MSDQQRRLSHASEDHRFIAEIGDEAVGLIDYSVDGEIWDVTRTETEPARQGQGIAGELTRFALDTVRSSGGSVRATCSYTASWIERHPDYADLLAG